MPGVEPAPVTSARVATLRAAIIGYGLAGRVFHASAHRRHARASRLRSHDRQPGARGAGGARPSARAGSSPDLDAVWDSAPDLARRRHPQRCSRGDRLAAIERGIAVVVDKPLAVSAGAGPELVARRSGRACCSRCFRTVAGTAISSPCARSWTRTRSGRCCATNRALSVGVPSPGPRRGASAPRRSRAAVSCWTSAAISSIRRSSSSGRSPHVYAEVESRRGLAGDDDVFIALRHASGPISHLHAGAVMPAPGPRLRVQGTRGGFLVNALDPQEAALRRGERPIRARPGGRVRSGSADGSSPATAASPSRGSRATGRASTSGSSRRSARAGRRRSIRTTPLSPCGCSRRRGSAPTRSRLTREQREETTASALDRAGQRTTARSVHASAAARGKPTCGRSPSRMIVGTMPAAVGVAHQLSLPLRVLGRVALLHLHRPPRPGARARPGSRGRPA